jgi:mannosyltransferase OCH1-like enzyme
MKKIIWMCWFQGEGAPMPALNRKCLNLWKDLNSDWEVNVLSTETIPNYVPEFSEIIKDSKPRGTSAQADLLRILLLEKFGGVWVDMSVYPMLPLSDFWDNIMNDTGFFSYRFMPRGSYDDRKMCETVSWFLCFDRPNHYLAKAWKEKYIENFKTLSHWPYFTFHESLTYQYDNDHKIREIINGMVQIDETIPHTAQHGWATKKESYVYKRPHI